MSARSRCPRLLLSRKKSESSRSAGAVAGSTTASAWTMASSCARARFKVSALGHLRGRLLDHHTVARDRIAQLHRQVVLVDAQPHVDLALVLGVGVAQMQRAQFSEGDLDLLDAEHLEVELVVAPLGEHLEVVAFAGRSEEHTS